VRAGLGIPLQTRSAAVNRAVIHAWHDTKRGGGSSVEPTLFWSAILY